MLKLCAGMPVLNILQCLEIRILARFGKRVVDFQNAAMFRSPRLANFGTSRIDLNTLAMFANRLLMRLENVSLVFEVLQCLEIRSLGYSDTCQFEFSTFARSGNLTSGQLREMQL